MFIESKPASIYSRSSDSDVDAEVEMASPIPQYRRPPAVLNHSSSSLSPLERSIPSFQSFVKRTPPPSRNKPLPPVPYSETLRSSPNSTRRSSSVYSRTVSQWAPTPESWKSRDVSSSTLFLQPSVYSLSTPELTLDQPIKTTLLVPRAYAPLIASPSPSPSRKSTPSPPLQPRPSVLLPPPPPMLRVAVQHIRTVSLDKAKAALRSPGAQHLFPEELRALAAAKKAKEQTVRSSRSFEGSVPTRSPTTPQSNLSPGLPVANYWPIPTAPCPDQQGYKLSDDYFGTSADSRMALAPVEKQLREPSIYISNESVLESVLEDYEDRGRVRIKSISGSMRKSREVESQQEDTTSGTTNRGLIAEAQRLANEYHELFQEQNKHSLQRKHSASSTSVKEAMKLVPQPLFFNPRAVSKQRTQQYKRDLNELKHSPLDRIIGQRRPAQREQQQQQKRNSPVPKDRALQFPFKLSLTPESTGIIRRRSSARSGSIPISPPFTTNFPQIPESTQSEKKKGSVTTLRRKLSIDDSSRFSAFYQRINEDAEQLAKEHKSSSKVTWDLQEQQVPALFSPILESTASDGRTKQQYSKHKRDTSDDSSSTGSGSVASSATRPALVSSVTRRIAAVTTSVFSSHPTFTRKNSTATIDSVDSRRSFPVISAPQPLSSAEKEALRNLTMPSVPTTVTASAAKRPSLFAGIRDQRRESKANRRREELKRTIKMVPSSIPETGSPGTGRGGVGGGGGEMGNFL